MFVCVLATSSHRHVRNLGTYEWIWNDKNDMSLHVGNALSNRSVLHARNVLHVKNDLHVRDDLYIRNALHDENDLYVRKSRRIM